MDKASPTVILHDASAAERDKLPQAGLELERHPKGNVSQQLRPYRSQVGPRLVLSAQPITSSWRQYLPREFSSNLQRTLLGVDVAAVVESS